MDETIGREVNMRMRMYADVYRTGMLELFINGGSSLFSHSVVFESISDFLPFIYLSLALTFSFSGSRSMFK